MNKLDYRFLLFVLVDCGRYSGNMFENIIFLKFCLIIVAQKIHALPEWSLMTIDVHVVFV